MKKVFGHGEVTVVTVVPQPPVYVVVYVVASCCCLPDACLARGGEGRGVFF